MTTKKAIEKRILQLCDEKNISVNALANICGIPPSTIYSMLNKKSGNPGVVSIKKICDGLDITLREFFDDEVFEHLEQEIV
ncbi:MAG: helix-turn-helix transcriptional regulator [Clostridia bacterium]|nr:helix-turn-helix transcriptional regulator [Clostridia bacterium]MBO5913958.1 helix-turn-helix transcriptional regulator [Clostridia bacterium]